MAGNDAFDGKGTIWVHDSPVGAPERDDVPTTTAPTAPAGPTPAPHPGGPRPISAPLAPAPKSGMGSTGCLLLLFVGGGIALGFAVLLALAIVAAVIMNSPG